MILKKAFLVSSMLLMASGLYACGGDEPTPAPKPGPEEPEQPVTPPAPEPEIITYNMPAKEIRGVWVATVGRMDWPKANVETLQKEEFLTYLDKFAKYNANAVIMQIRPCADAFYASELEPWSEYISGQQGKDPGYDVLGWMIEETHKRGMGFHAWMNPYRISNSATAFATSGAANHPAKLHPEWTMKYDNLLIYRPALPEVKQHLLNVVDDLISKYDVDGIHFDDYFYPYPKKGVEIDDAADYAKYGAAYSNVGDFRRAQVDEVIEKVHNLLVAKKPGIVFSISPYGVWRNKASDPVAGSDSNSLQNYDDLYADVRKWCQNGWIDLVVPQLYASTSNVNMNFTKMCTWWNANSFEARLAIGHALYRFGVPAEGAPYQTLDQLSDQFRISRSNKNTCGSFLFNATCFNENKINILSRLAQVYADKALIPVIGKESEAAPAKPGDIAVEGRTIAWKEQPGMRYAVYTVKPSSVEGRWDARLAAVLSEPSWLAPGAGNYAVSVLNRDNAESELSQPVKVD